MNWLVPFEIGVTTGLIFVWAVLGLAIAFRLLNFPDLTVEASLPLGAAVFAALTKADVLWPVASLIAVLAGAVAGAITGFLHARFRINKFLAGIIVVAISYSISLRIMGASNIGLLRTASVFDFFSALDQALNSYYLGTILGLVLIIGIGIGLLLWGLSSRKGIRLRVVGSNPEYARALGINVTLNLIAGLAITNSLAAVSGVLLAMHQGFSDVSMGQGVLILALAALTIGERLLPEQVLSLPSFVLSAAVLGSILYQVVIAYAIRFGLAPTDLKLATAVMVLLIVALRVSRNGELFAEELR